MSLWNTFCYLALKWLPSLLFFSGPDTLKEDLAEVLLGLVIGVLIVLVYSSRITLQYLHKSHEVIRREWSLLDAVSKDFQEAYSSVEKIKRRANQVWESEVLNLRGITQMLSEGETRWVRKTGDLSLEARRCTEEFRRENERWGLLAFMKAIPTFDGPIDLAFGMRRAKRAILEYRNAWGRQCGRQSIALLEESRGRVRRLQDRPIDETIIIPPKPPLPSGVSLVLERLISEKPNLVHGLEDKILTVVIQLKLLRALMKDLQGVGLESQMEKVWLEEARKIVDQAHKAIHAFLREAAKQMLWLSRISDYFRYRPKLKEVMENVGDLLIHLLETKERYGFSFVKRGLSRDASSNPHPGHVDGGGSNASDSSISSIVEEIRLQMQEQELQRRSTSREPSQSVSELLNMLQELENLLNEQEAIEGAVGTRRACFSLLKKLYSDLDASVKKPQWNEIHQITRTAKLLKRCIKVYTIKVVEDSCSVVGLEEDIHKLVLKLTSPTIPNGEQDQCQRIFSIVGMRGVGKTTLAKEIRNHKSIVNHFAVRRLVTIQETNDAIHLLQSVGNQIMNTQEETVERDYWINKLQSFLREHKTLVILDGLFSIEAWDSLKPGLISDGSVSTIVLTTCDKEVAFHANQYTIHWHRLRTSGESWEFFTQIVTCPSDQEVEMAAKKVLARTGGLPLAILRLGYLLSERRITREELLVVLERIHQGQNQLPWVANLEANKDDFQLQPALENCLSYFQLFPRDFEIPARRLVAVWVAQGIIPTQNAERANELEATKTEEQVAYEYLLDLIDHNMVQAVERKQNGKVLTCRFPSILKEIWLRSRRQNGTARSWSLCASFGQQVAYRFDHNEDGSDSRTINSLRSNVLREDNHPLSVTFFDNREGQGPGEDVCNFLVRGIGSGNFRDLLVLDIERVFKPLLPSNIGKLKQLKYLGLRWTYIETLPSSIGQLVNLQTLDLKHTSLRTLSSSIWKLKRLQNLHLDHSCQIEVMPNPSDISMKNLHKLSGVFVDREGRALMDGLHKLSNLRKLRLTFQLTLPQQEIMSKNIVQLTHLQSLSLRSVNVDNEPQDLKLEHLSHLQKLSSLYLFGKLENLCLISELPRSLTELTLSASGLSRGRLLLEMLAALPKLKFLSFFSRSYVDREMFFIRGGFPRLLVLKMWALNDLERLNVEEGAMPKLREFEIRDCRNLSVTSPDTTGLAHLRTLQELKLTDMPEAYVAFVKEEFARAKRQYSNKIVHFPTIKIINNQPRAQ